VFITCATVCLKPADILTILCPEAKKSTRVGESTTLGEIPNWPFLLNPKAYTSCYPPYWQTIKELLTPAAI
jgi:hypothetical protein